MRQQEPSDVNVLRSPVKVEDLHFYHKADAIYQLTYLFCQRFLPPYGDRTVDQMVQAACSGKQNIVGGIEAGRTSSETEIRLLNIARSSLQELREDYEDYLKTRRLTLWTKDHTRYYAMLAYCRTHNSGEEYLPYAKRWDAEAARRYIQTSLRREYASDQGTDLNEVLPKISPLNRNYLTKKQSVFERIAAFVEKFKGVGGKV